METGNPRENSPSDAAREFFDLLFREQWHDAAARLPTYALPNFVAWAKQEREPWRQVTSRDFPSPTPEESQRQADECNVALRAEQRERWLRKFGAVFDPAHIERIEPLALLAAHFEAIGVRAETDHRIEDLVSEGDSEIEEVMRANQPPGTRTVIGDLPDGPDRAWVLYRVDVPDKVCWGGTERESYPQVAPFARVDGRWCPSTWEFLREDFDEPLWGEFRYWGFTPPRADGTD